MYDTITYAESRTNDFHLAKDSTYVFFIQSRRLSGDDPLYFGELLSESIEGISFSQDLEKDLLAFNKWFQFDFTNEIRGISFDILHRSSPVTLTREVLAINKINDYYSYAITVKSEEGTSMDIHLKDLICIGKYGSLQLNHRYLFFLTPVDDGLFILTDQWLGIFELNSSLKAALD